MFALQRIVKLNRTHFNRPLAGKFLVKTLGDHMDKLLCDVRFRNQGLGSRYLWHGILMLKTFLKALERGRHVENRLAALHRLNATGAEAVAVSQDLNVVDDRLGAVAGTQKIAVERVNTAVARHGLLGGIQRLADDLSTEHLAQAEIFTFPRNSPSSISSRFNKSNKFFSA